MMDDVDDFSFYKNNNNLSNPATTSRMESEPIDKNSIVLIGCVMMGIAVMFPWNALISAIDFFQDSLADGDFAFHITIAFNLPQFVVMILVVKFGPLFSEDLRMYPTLAFYTLALIVIPLISSVGLNSHVALGLTLALAVLLGVAFGIQFGTSMGIAGRLPNKYTTAVMSGQGISGIVVGIIRIITKLSLPNNNELSAWLYFLIGALFVIAATVCYFLMMKSPFTRYHFQRAEDDNEGGVTALNRPFGDYLLIMRQIWKEALSVFWVFFVSLSLFPGISSLWQSVIRSLNSTGWFIVINVFLFQLFDFVGRTWPMFVTFPKRLLLPASFARTIFFVLFILCIHPQVFVNDFWMYMFMTFFAFTNGFIGTWSMVYGPTNVDPKDQEVAGISMGFFLQLGIFVASWFGLAVNWFVEDVLVNT